MFNKIKEFFVGKPAPVAEVVSAPYKMPEPPAVTLIPLVVEVAPVPVGIEAVIAAPVAEVVVETVVAMDPVAVALDLEPAVLATPAKKTRTPRAPKAAAPVAKAVKEKAPAKAKASNVVAMKAPVKAKSKK